MTSEKRIANSIAITDTDFVVSQALDREVFTKLTEPKIVAVEMVFPITVGSELRDHHRRMLSTVASQIALTVTIDI